MELKEQRVVERTRVQLEDSGGKNRLQEGKTVNWQKDKIAYSIQFWNLIKLNRGGKHTQILVLLPLWFNRVNIQQV